MPPIYFFEKGRVVIITSGFVKKDQKTEKDELTKAYKLMKIYKGDEHEA
nr:type II toxin-antitoxin system RelE/ParE family toxin [Leptospira borgpetersenii]